MTNTSPKKLYRSRTNRRISGVLGGASDYFGIDATALRVGYVLITLFTGVGPGVIGYILATFLIPLEPDGFDTTGGEDAPHFG